MKVTKYRTEIENGVYTVYVPLRGKDTKLATIRPCKDGAALTYAKGFVGEDGVFSSTLSAYSWVLRAIVERRTVTKNPGGPKLTKAEAEKYVRAIRNVNKRDFAEQLFKYFYLKGPFPKAVGLGYMGEQAVCLHMGYPE